MMDVVVLGVEMGRECFGINVDLFGESCPWKGDDQMEGGIGGVEPDSQPNSRFHVSSGLAGESEIEKESSPDAGLMDH